MEVKVVTAPTPPRVWHMFTKQRNLPDCVCCFKTCPNRGGADAVTTLTSSLSSSSTLVIAEALALFDFYANIRIMFTLSLDV